MDENPASVRLDCLRELRAWLAGQGIAVDQWGTGQAKRVEDLWSEIAAGESVLTAPPPVRRVSFVSVIVSRGDKKLTEMSQVLSTGATRQRGLPPAEKLLPGEDAEAAAFRCVEEELGVSRESCRIVPGTHREEVREEASPSYPGLMTRYSAHQVEMEVPGLPETDFTTRESAGSEDSTVKEHRWDWT